MKTPLLHHSFIFVLALASIHAQAQAVFFGGDPNLKGAISSEQNTSVADSRLYEDFTLLQATQVQGVFGNFIFVGDTPVRGLYYEIRQGVSAGNGGTLLASGTLGATLTATSFLITSDIGTQRVYTVSGSITGLSLAAGDYFLSVGVVGSGSGGALVVATDGINGVGAPLANSIAYFDSLTFGRDFELTSSDRGYSIGLNGIAAVPAPLAGLSFTLGLLRRRKRA